MDNGNYGRLKKTKKTLIGFFILFTTGTYAGIGTKCVEYENITKGTKKSFVWHISAITKHE